MLAFLWLCVVQDIDRRIQDLSHDDPEIREAAAEALVKEGLPMAPSLVKLLGSQDSDLARRGEAILRKMGLRALHALEGAGIPRAREVAGEIILAQAQEYLRESHGMSVTWEGPSSWPGSPELELGSGSGHGGGLAWTVFRPGKEEVAVFRLAYAPGWKPYTSKWPPDDAEVKAARATVKRSDYDAMLRVIATLEKARVEKKEVSRWSFSTGNFYSFARVASDREVFAEEEYAGYPGTLAEPEYAKARGMGDAAADLLRRVEFVPEDLAAEDRAWVGRRFLRDWTRMARHESYSWWVRERMLVLVGVAGDPSVLPKLAEIIRGDPTKRPVYHAINAATRLLGKDVRGKPAEEMDVVAVRKRLLPLLEK